MPARHGQVRVHTRAMGTQVSPAPSVGGRFWPSLQLMRKLERSFDGLLHAPGALTVDLPIHLAQHEPGNGVIITSRVGRGFIDVRGSGGAKAKQAVRHLTGKHKINRMVHALAVGSLPGLMAP